MCSFHTNLFFPFFFFNDTATTEIYTLSLHDALPISLKKVCFRGGSCGELPLSSRRSEEHTSELQSPKDLVCRLLLEKKKKKEIWRKEEEKKTVERRWSQEERGG